MSDSKKMSSPYVVLENRPLDQWKVTELKEELKKRKLATKGLKEELVKRLDEAVRAEIDEAERDLDTDLNSEVQPEDQSQDDTIVANPVGKNTDIVDDGGDKNESTVTVAAEKNVDIMDDSGDKNESTVAVVAEKNTNIMDDSGDKNESTLAIVAEKNTDIMDDSGDKNESTEKDDMTEKLNNENSDNKDVQMEIDTVQADDPLQPLGEKLVPEGKGDTVSTDVEAYQVVQEISVETSVLVSESVVSEGMEEKELKTVENQNKGEVSYRQFENGESKPESQSLKEEEGTPDSSDISSHVVKVSQVKSETISIDTISITEKNELKDNVVADDVKLELDVKPEMVHPISSNVVLEGEKSESAGVGEPHEDKVTTEERDINNAENIDLCKKNDSGDVGSSEKLNLDRSSGDDSMEDDALESKQIDSKFSSDEVGDGSEKIKVPLLKKDDHVDVMVEDVPADKNIASIDDKNGPGAASTKRKLHDQEAAPNSETIKRQRKWNSEGLKVPEQQSSNLSASTTPKDALQTSVKRTFSRSDSTANEEVPKERVVPQSSKPPTTSLRIDNFLRPFTLKAVQELLGKTGTIVSFWMDHIKTHCFVTYSSVDEAIETRNAVFNLQWPVNGGRLLVAEFVNPQEVKNRVDAPPPSPVSKTPALPPPPPPPLAATQPPQPSPRLQVQRQQQQQLPPPPPSLPPPPPLSNPPQTRERALPPPPPLPEKVDAPIVTLDDLFRKTRATPRIYYLPLSDKQVAAKLKGQGKSTLESSRD